MSRYLLALVSVLAVSACTNNNPPNTSPPSPGSPPRNETDDKNTTSGLSTDRLSYSPNITGNQTSTSSQNRLTNGSVHNVTGTSGSQSTDRMGASPLAADIEERKDVTLTAGDQSENETDRLITQQIRQAVVADPELSIMAKNCTIITINGMVTIRGSVNNATERLSIKSKAEMITGVQKVDNLLEISK